MSYEQISKTEPIARKNYKCIWCGEQINKGEKYCHDISKYDGEFQNHHWHLECLNALYEEYDNEFTPYDNERPAKKQTKREGSEDERK